MAIATLTDAYIRTRARPIKGSVIDFDNVTKGLAIRFTPTGIPMFLFCYGSGVTGGNSRRMPIGAWSAVSGKTSRSVIPERRKQAAEYGLMVTAGRDPHAERQATKAANKAAEKERKAAMRKEEREVTVNQLCDCYLFVHGPKLRSATRRAAELRMARYIRPKLGTDKAKDVTKADVAALLKPLLVAGKGSEAVHVLSLVTGLYNFAVDDDELESITDNPARGLKKKLITKAIRPKPKDRALTTRREFRAFYFVTQPGIYKGQEGKAMHPDEAACLRLMMATGCRPSEASGLPWCEIDFPARVWNKSDDSFFPRSAAAD
jgi:hypothetical protein